MANLPTPFDASTGALRIPQVTPTDEAVSPAEHLAATRYRFIPAEMRATHCWMVARDKKPYQVTANSLMQGKVIVTDHPVNPHDPAMHCTFDMTMQAIAADPTLELGFVLGVGNTFACVDLDDLDKVAPKHREGAAGQQRLIRERLTPITYSEVSISGKGWHFVGRCPKPPTDKASGKHSEYRIDLLLRSFLVVTGDHQPDAPNATTEIADISSQVKSLHSKFNEVDGTDAAPPVVATITTAQCSEKRLIARLGGDWDLGPVYHDGNKAHDWSEALYGFCCSAAQITTDGDTVYRVIANSGFVRRAEDKGGESRVDKLHRTFKETWHRALIAKEPDRQKAAASSTDGEIDLDRQYTRADLWQDEHKAVLNQYVIHLVRKEAERMIRDELHSNSSAEVIAPLFLYISERERGSLAKLYGKLEQHELASACTDAQIKALHLAHDITVPQLDQYICQAVRWIHRDRNFEYLKSWFDARFYIVKNHFGKVVVFQIDDPNAPEQLIGDFQKAFSEYVYYGEIDHKKDEIEKKPFVGAWISTAGNHQYIGARMMYDTTAPSVNTSTGRIRNLFTGFAIEADETLIDGGSAWPLISEHLWRVICSENPEKADYLIKYLAHLIQRPWELPKAAIAIYSGAQGAGKSQLVVLVKELIGAKYCFETSDPKHVFGQFTSSTMEKLVIHGAEMLATVDDASNAKAKNIITDEFVALEGKFKDVKTARNYARLFLTTNQRHAVQIEASDRRYLVLRVSAIFGPTHSFWDAYYPNERTGYLGYRAELPAFMRYLRDLDISNFNPRAIPQTAEKGEQKLLSLKGANELLFTILSEGQLPIWSERQGNSIHGDVWVTPLAEWKRCLKLQPNLKGVPSQVGMIFKPITHGANRTMRMSIGGIDKGQIPGSYHCTCLPPLAEARRRFLDHLSIPAHDWGDDPDCEWNRG
ncbi:DUF5906 domain-containing protein [Pseudotabrizicola sp. 4114]|uniref:DUF5906 domain-containing protein n=1 Tax=Pseudotabrizicola sp. 4114 TaxID=2817731 RepID=UPI0028620A7D|nr:hypothetical protein [Pseudorhodobacter sp. 4114]